jgi:hypothetical protein
MRENRTYSLSGGRWPARKRATSDPTPVKRPNKGRQPLAEGLDGRAWAKQNTAQPRIVCPLRQNHGVPVAARVRSGIMNSASAFVFEGKRRKSQPSCTDLRGGRGATGVSTATCSVTHQPVPERSASTTD